MHLRPFAPADTDPVVALWNACGLVRSWNDPRKDIQRKLTIQPELFLVAEDRGEIIGTVMVGYDGHRGWINYLATSPDRQREGIGRALMAEAERLLFDLGCPKINLQIRSGNEAVASFYRALGYTVEEVTSMGKRLIPDE